MSLQFAEFYQNYTSKNLENGNKIFFKPNIPPKKLANAISSYASHVKADDVFVLADETVFGKADNGLLITNSEILIKELFEERKQIPLMEVKQVAFEGLLGGNFIVNHKKLITFTQLQKSDRNKLLDTLNAFFIERMQSWAVKADEIREENEKQIEQDNIEKEKKLLEEKAQLEELETNFFKMSLDEIVGSQDKFIIDKFIQENDLILLKKTDDEMGVNNPELLLDFKNLDGLKELIGSVAIDEQTVQHVLESIFYIFDINSILYDKYQNNRVFETLLYQNTVTVSLIMMLKVIAQGYLKAILSYMPSERAQNIIDKHDKVYNLILSQCLYALAANETLGNVLVKSKRLSQLDPNSDQVLIEKNRMSKIVQKNIDHDFELFRDFVRETLNKDLSKNEDLGIDEEQYSFPEVKQMTSIHVRGCICRFLGGGYREQIECLEHDVNEVLDYLEEKLKMILSTTYL